MVFLPFLCAYALHLCRQAERAESTDKEIASIRGAHSVDCKKLNARQYKHNDNVGFCTSKEEVKQAFLAGLRARKEKVKKEIEEELLKCYSSYPQEIEE